MDVNRISGYLPGKMVFFLMQVGGLWWLGGLGGADGCRPMCGCMHPRPVGLP